MRKSKVWELVRNSKDEGEKARSITTVELGYAACEMEPGIIGFRIEKPVPGLLGRDTGVGGGYKVC